MQDVNERRLDQVVLMLMEIYSRAPMLGHFSLQAAQVSSVLAKATFHVDDWASFSCSEALTHGLVHGVEINAARVSQNWL